MTEPDVHTLAGPYALDALPDDERARFEAHLAACQFCTTEVAELREAAVKLATQVAAPPPPRLKADVLNAIESVRQLPPQVGGGALRQRYSRRSVFALAAAALVIAGAGGVAVDQYRDKQAVLQTNEQMAAVLSQPDAKTSHGKVDGGGQATVVMSARADAVVVVLRDLHRPPNGKVWQLWLMDASQRAVSIGLTSGDLTKVVQGNVVGNTTFGITAEPNGGSPGPTSAPVAAVEMT
ncbi:anti-sigma factor [Kribbella sandramycini]|uniref:Regulator of SigK n=1 Tax=Kribbella sandramycini TaxID=60450 RepID=A0A7Y4L9N9_9ACTN|nr:anti-sigma factor [Kribbella sandramycini]MBB6567244.1 anti-sigma-K factor RskA [Kribbella sandramycini]NOL45781.1 anti-sigma factor [Kribbella sandramycini]